VSTQQFCLNITHDQLRVNQERKSFPYCTLNPNIRGLDRHLIQRPPLLLQICRPQRRPRRSSHQKQHRQHGNILQCKRHSPKPCIPPFRPLRPRIPFSPMHTQKLQITKMMEWPHPFTHLDQEQQEAHDGDQV
jgi:hypothetical protein